MTLQSWRKWLRDCVTAKDHISLKRGNNKSETGSLFLTSPFYSASRCGRLCVAASCKHIFFFKMKKSLPEHCMTLLVIALLLCFKENVAVQNSANFAEVAVYNGLKSEIDIAVKSLMGSVFFGNVKSESVSSYKKISDNVAWNVTLKTSTRNPSVVLVGHLFKKGRKSILAVHDTTGAVSVLVILVDTGESVDSSKALLGVDEALLTVYSDKAGKLTVNWRSENCHECQDQVLMNVVNSNSTTVKIGTKWPMNIDIRSANFSQGITCKFRKHYGEHGEYKIIVLHDSSKIVCSQVLLKEGDSTYLPIAVMFAIYAGLAIIYTIWIRCIWSKRKQVLEYDLSQNLSKPRNFMDSGTLQASGSSEPGASAAKQVVKPKKRVQSLDAFRGVAITIMIFVNYQGGDYYFFEHSLWNGLTVADLVFPWFIFIMGTSIDLSQRSLLSKGIRKQTVFKKVLIRSMKLFLIGLFLNNGRYLTKWRIPGVLQRFGVSYFVVATVNLLMSPSEEKQDNSRRFDWTDHIRDVWMFWGQWVTMTIILTIYLMITFLVHEQGCPRGYLGTGGIGDHGKYPHCTGGAAGYIDRAVFGNNHMYGNPTCKKIYKTTVHYDPEGLLGCLTSIFLTFLGLHSGRILCTFSSGKGRITRWLIWSLLLGALTIALTGGTKNDGVIPINKNLWSPSFIFATAAMAYFLLAVMYYVIDVRQWWDGAPLTFAGMNAIMLYCGHEVFHNFFPFNFNVNHPTHATILTRSAVGVTIWMIVAYYCYLEKIFFKV